jgi:hypothetical protein
MFGATEARSAAASAWISTNYPEANLVGRYSSPFSPIEEMDHGHILSLLEEARPDILLVASETPSREVANHAAVSITYTGLYRVGATVLGPDAIGMLFHLKNWMKSNQRLIWLIAARPSVLRAYRASDLKIISK